MSIEIFTLLCYIFPEGLLSLSEKGLNNLPLQHISSLNLNATISSRIKRACKMKLLVGKTKVTYANRTK